MADKSFKSLISNLTIHGLPKIFKKQTVFYKLLWAFFFIVALISCSYLISQNIIEYYRYPVVTNLNIINQNSAEFPTVTICTDRYWNNMYSNRVECSFDGGVCENFNIRGDCWEFNSPYVYNWENRSKNYQVTNHQTKKGFEHGLQMVLELPNYIPYVKVNLHNVSKTSFQFSDYLVTSQIETTFAIGRTLVNKLTPPFSGCIDEIEARDGKGGSQMYTYFQDSCFDHCRDRHYFQYCGFSDLYDSVKDMFYYDLDWYKYHYLVETVQRNCNRSTLDKVALLFDQLGKHKICEQECPMECKTFYLQVKTRTNLRLSPSDLNKTFLNLYYEEFDYTLIEEIPKIQPVDLFGYIGSYLGIFLGISMLVFADIIEIISWLGGALYSKNASKKKSVTNWCHANSKKESNNENEVYVGNFEISDLDKSSINVFLTSKSLLRLATVSQKHLYIENDHNISMIGSFDKTGRFHPFGLAVFLAGSSNESQFTLNSLKKCVEDSAYAPSILIAKKDEEIDNAFINVFGSLSKRIVLFEHMMDSLDLKLNDIQSARSLKHEIFDLKNSVSDVEFSLKVSKFIEKWGKHEELSQFIEYFQREWTQEHNRGWYAGYAPEIPHNLPSLIDMKNQLQTQLTLAFVEPVVFLKTIQTSLLTNKWFIPTESNETLN